MCIKSDFKEIFFKLITNDRSDKILSPGGCLPQGYIHLLNHEKMCIKSEIEVMRPFYDITILSQMGCLPLPRLYT